MMPQPRPESEHQWLQKLVGEWTYEAKADGAPGEASHGFTGTERVRSVGEVWVIAEGHCPAPDGTTAGTMMTLGYDSRSKRFVGTWIGSMMTHLWVYDGRIEPDRMTLTLESDGPSFADQKKTAKYRDVIRFTDDDNRVLTGSLLGDDGRWTTFMTTHYRRKK
jgi:hypothetical protein